MPRSKNTARKEAAPSAGSNEQSKIIENLAAKLEDTSDSDDAVVIGEADIEGTLGARVQSADPVFDMTNESVCDLSEAEKQLLKEELKKTEDEITTLKQVLLARQKHASELKRKLGLNPLVELTNDINKGLKVVTDSEAFQKTQEVASATADTVKEKWNGMRNSSLFKSFESKLGSAYNNARMAASTSIDHLAGATRGNGSTATTPADEVKPMP